MIKQIDLRSKGTLGDDYRQRIDTPALSRLEVDGNGDVIALSSFTCRTNFDLLPAGSAGASADPFLSATGTGTVVISRAAKGGVNLKSQATTPADNDNVLLVPYSDTNMKAPITATSRIRFATRVAINTITAMFATIGLSEQLTDADPTGTSGEGALFGFDPTGEWFKIANGAPTDGSPNWVLAHKVNGADTFTDTGIAVVAGKPYDLVIVIGDDLKAKFYIDGQYVGEGPELTSGDPVSAFAGFELTGSPGGQKDIDVRYVAVSRAAE